MSDHENLDDSSESVDTPESVPPTPPPPPGPDTSTPEHTAPDNRVGGNGASGNDAPDSGAPDNKGLMLVLSYLWILALIPLLVEKDSEVQWHAKNGLVWTVAEFLMHMALAILGMATAFVGCFLGPVLMFGWLIVRVLGILKAVKGERLELPVLAQFNDKF